MRMTLLCLVCAMTACAVDTTDTVGANERIDSAQDAYEPVYVNGRQCQLVFPGGATPDTDVYAIWPLGVDGIVDAPYNTDDRPNMYAVFGTGATADEIHHVDGYNQFDHYHVVEGGAHDLPADPSNSGHVQNTEWDVLTYWPGPNFDPSTYVSAKSVDELKAQSAAGILSPVLTLPDIGFPPLVLYAPVDCTPPAAALP